MLEIQKNNQTIQLRNLQEQVQKNKEDIAQHYNIDRVLANFGIKIIGQVETEAELPLPFDGNYGDAYAVGSTEPYNFYIWTRADVNGGHPEDYWFNVGGIGVVGPQGPQGEQGPIGPKGEATVFNAGTYPSGNIGDLYLMLAPGTANGNIYKMVNDGTGTATPQLTGNIRGPQGVQGDQGPEGPAGPAGPQGPKGDTGDVGGFININGILENTSQLPTPASLNDLTRAYLIGSGAPYDLYIQVGSTSDEAIWQNMGPMNAATLVTVNGVAQNVWNADTKLDKITTSSNYIEVYSKSYDGTNSLLQTTSSNVAGTIALRDSRGNIEVGNNPYNNNDAVSKKYFTSNNGSVHHYHLTGTSSEGYENDLSFSIFDKGSDSRNTDNTFAKILNRMILNYTYCAVGFYENSKIWGVRKISSTELEILSNDWYTATSSEFTTINDTIV